MSFLQEAYLGFQQITGLSSAVGLTLPLGTQQASATAATLNGNILTVGGTLTGAFAIGQYVTGTGIPINTYIVKPLAVPANGWLLSNPCTTEGAEAVTAFAPTSPDFALIRCTGTGASVNWRADGPAPTSTVGIPMLPADPPFRFGGSLTAIQFIQSAGTAALNVAYYSLSG